MWKKLTTKFPLLFHTVKYLKTIQIYYRLYYFIRARARKVIGFHYLLSKHSNSIQLNLSPSIDSHQSYEKSQFTFLNLTIDFYKKIDWNYSEYGKLWTYNLAYFDYLHQNNFSTHTGLNLINDFIEQSSHVKDGLEPFPISLRGINWIKFLSYNGIKNQKIDDSLYAQYQILMDNLEYHLLGNHLLENGFSLLFAAYYFKDETYYSTAKTILTMELSEQILEDGAHFELSPMYHQIMLFRVLECINLVKNNSWKEKELLLLFQEKAEIMLGWIDMMTFKNGDIPLLNDSTNGIAPKTKALLEYAMNIGIEMKQQSLNESGYRKFSNNKYECIVDVGNIGPDYIPGHAHADTFNFVLYVDEKPFIVDTGLSTYETNDRRMFERSTSAHNTVEIASKNQSNVWGAFRVAERAHVLSLEETNSMISAVHDGYKKSLGALHERIIIFEDDRINITDNILSDNIQKSVARLHFHPSVDEDMIHKYIDLNGLKYSIKEYLYALEFNKYVESKVLEIILNKTLETRIIL